jgi:hypothetical protein
LLAPGLVLSHSDAGADPVMLAFVFGGLLLDRRGRRIAALVCFAYAILVKEVAVLALIPWGWRAISTRDYKRLGALGLTVVPYVGWSIWVRARTGEFPFLAHTVARSTALAWPGVGIHTVFQHRAPDHVADSVIVVVTAVVGFAAAWAARKWFPVAGITVAYAAMTLCLGAGVLSYEGEMLRVLIAPQAFALLCIVYAVTRRGARWDNESSPVGVNVP